MTTAYVARHDRHRPIVRLLLEDTVPTLGERARSEVLRLAANYEELAREWIAAGDSLAEAQRSFDRSVVDGLQETAHDLFWATDVARLPAGPATATLV